MEFRSINVAVMIGYCALALPAIAQSMPPDILQGVCTNQSAIAEGPEKQDLTQRKSRFYCDTAVIQFFDQPVGHVLIQFTEKQSDYVAILGFGGVLEKDRANMADIRSLYLPNQNQPPFGVDDGYCRFFFSGKHPSSVVCGAQVLDHGRKIAAVVNFTAKPSQ